MHKSDGFLIRFFIAAFTSMYKTMKNPKKIVLRKKATCYANRSQVRQINEMHASVEGEKLAGVKVQKKEQQEASE